MALQMFDAARGNPDIWVEDQKDGSRVRVTTAIGNDVLPVWSPDGRRLAYGSGTLTERRLSIAAADGTGEPRELPCPDAYCEPTDWSPDGRHLIVNTRLAIGAALQMCGACRSRPAGQPSRFFPGRSRVPTRGYRRTGNGSPTFRKKLAGRRCPSAGCRAHRGVASCPATAAANPSGAAMGRNCSTSTVTAAFVANRCNANRAES